jgi:hypothetical protein
MAMGARKAFQQLTNDDERGRWLSLPFAGCDGQPENGAGLGKRKAAGGDDLHIITDRNGETMAGAIRRGIQPPEDILTMPAPIPPLNVLSPFRPF